MLSGLLAAIAAVVIALATLGSPKKNTLAYDAHLFAIQFFLISGFGAVVAFLIDLEKRTRETREQRRKFEIETVTSLLDELDEIYRKVKRTRRLLRLDERLGRLDNARLTKHMLELNQDQEEAERFRKRLDALDTSVAGLSTIAGPAKNIDQYLSNLWGPFERTSTAGTWLDPFTASAHSEESNFNNFKTAYDRARGGLIRMLAAMNTDAR